MNLRTSLYQNSPTIAADPNEPRFVVIANRLDADFSCALQVSGDGGRGWITADPVPKLPAGADKCYAPEIAFDEKGTLYYLFVGLKEPGNEPMGVFLTNSVDRARTFSKPRRVLGPLNFGVRMALDPSFGRHGRLHLVWLKATSDPPLGGFGSPPNPIMTSHSDDRGETFSTPLQVSDPGRRFVVAPALVLGADRSVHVAYFDLKEDARDYLGLEGPTWEGTWTLLVASSTDGGRTFEKGTIVDDDVRPPDRVMLIFTMAPASLASHERFLCATWPDARHGDPDILARCSINGGATWGRLRRVNDDNSGNGRDQLLPKLAFAPNGRLDAMFYDRRRDIDNVLNDVYFTSTPSVNRDFAPNIRLTQDNFESRIGPKYVNVSALGQVDFGSRLGLMSASNHALAAWADTRNARPLFQEQNIFASRVEFEPSTNPRKSLWLLGGVGLAIGAISLAAVRRRLRGPLQPADSRGE